MKKGLILFTLSMFCALSVFCQSVWNGPAITFSKAAFADPTLAANQDRITPTTWLTRANTRGLFNIFSEASFTHNVSPANTRWANGTLANYQSLTYQDWETWAGGIPNIPTIVNRPAVLHLISENIYIGITFTSWGVGGSGGGSFSYQRSTPAIPAPVKLSEFYASAKDKRVALNWRTASEENSSHFLVERSWNGSQFTPVGDVKAAGQSSIMQQYSFIDEQPLPHNFYRLKSVDLDGKFQFGKIISVKLKTDSKLELYPVPASDVLNIQVDSETSSVIQVIDLAGRVVKFLRVDAGRTSYALPVSDLKAGCYFIKAGEDTKPFMKE